MTIDNLKETYERIQEKLSWSDLFLAIDSNRTPLRIVDVALEDENNRESAAIALHLQGEHETGMIWYLSEGTNPAHIENSEEETILI